MIPWSTSSELPSKTNSGNEALIRIYRVAHLVADNLLLTSNWELRFSIRSLYRASHVLVDLGWVDFDFCVPPTCPAASAKFPSAQAESGRQRNTRNPSPRNPVYKHMGRPELWRNFGLDVNKQCSATRWATLSTEKVYTFMKVLTPSCDSLDSDFHYGDPIDGVRSFMNPV